MYLVFFPLLLLNIKHQYYERQQFTRQRKYYALYTGEESAEELLETKSVQLEVKICASFRSWARASATTASPTLSRVRLEMQHVVILC